MTRGRQIALGLTLALATAGALFALSLPSLVTHQAIAWVNDNTDRQLRIDSLSINPFNWQVTVAGVGLSESDGETPFVAFDRLQIDLAAWRSLAQRALVVDQLEIDAPYLRVIKTGENRFNFSDLANLGGDSPSVEDKPLLFAVNNLAIHGGRAEFTDLSRPQISHAIRDFELALPFVGNVPLLIDRFITPQLSLTLDNTPIEARGELKPFAESLEATLQLKLSDINLASYTPYLPRERPVSLDHGRLALDITLGYRITEQNKPQIRLEGEATLTAVSILDRTGEEVFFLPLAHFELQEADLLARRALLDQITVYGLKVFVFRDERGEWNHARMAKDPAFAKDPADEEPSRQQAASPQVEIGNIRLREGEIMFRDASVPGGFDKDVREVSLDIAGFKLGDGATSFDLALKVDQGAQRKPGRVAVSGEVTMAPFSLEALIAADRLSLVRLERYLPPELSLRFDAGNADADLAMAIGSNDDGLTAELSGRLGVRSLKLVEPATGSDILAWESLQLDGLSADLGPGAPKVKIGEVALNGFQSKVLVTKSGQLNLHNMLGQANKAHEGAAGGPAESETVQIDKAGSESQVSIGQVVLQDGTVVFSDEHLPTPYRATLTELGGRISNLSSAASAPAEVDLRGRLDNHSKLRIEGQLDPLKKAFFADLKVRFDTIELAPMTPYSATYLGYAIAKGKLFLDLDYKIDGSSLAAENRVFLDQFTFGDHQQSEQATKLPVKLAVALLKDRKGEIHLDLPVRGNLDDPQFSVVGVVFRMLKNLLVKAATAPFALLAALFDGEEDFSTISFSFGKQELAAPEKAKLARLASVLRERPELKLAVSGYADREQDPEAYRRAQLEQKVSRAANKDLNDIAPNEYERYLKQAYRQADFPKPRNIFGRVKSLPRQEMEKLILANTQAGDAVMKQLAQSRAQAVLDHLVKVEQLPAERIFLQQQDVFAPPGDARSGNVVAFGLATD